MWPWAILSDGGALLGTSLAATDVLMIAMKLLMSLKHVALTVAVSGPHDV